jgi:paraquat-inducible protein B
MFDGKDKAVNAVNGDGVAYRAIFTGPVSGLKQGAPVQLIGQEVGAVRSVDTAFDARSGEINTEVVIALDPVRIQVTGVQMASLGTSIRGALDQMISALVGKGLRAEIDSSMPVIGQKMLALKMVPGAQPAVLGPGPIPEIPSTSGSDIEAIMANVGEITDKVKQMPLDAIGAQVHEITTNVSRLASSPELTASLQHLDQSLANIQDLSKQAREQIGPVLTEVHHAAREAETTLASAKNLIGNTVAATSGPETAGLPHTLYELEQAARSLRELADYLDQHPEALLKGKGKNQ